VYLPGAETADWGVLLPFFSTFREKAGITYNTNNSGKAG